MQDGTPEDQSQPDPIASGISNGVKPEGFLAPSGEVSVPLARPAHTPGATRRSLKDFDIFLYPMSPGQALADVGLILVLAVICDLVIGLALGLVVAFLHDIPPDGLEDIPPSIRKGMLFPMLAARAILTIGLVTAFVWHRGQTSRAIGLHKRGLARDGLLGIALTVVIYGMIFATLGLLALVWPTVLEQMQENASGLLEMIPRASPLGFLFMALTIGIYEEVLFRGFIMPRLRRATGSWVAAVILSSAIFTALHAAEQTPAALIIVSILSVSFSVVTIWHRSIVPAIVAHALFDFSQFLFLFYW